MKNLSRTLLAFLAAAAVFSCAKEPVQQSVTLLSADIIIADFPAFDASSTKTIGTPDAGKTQWQSGDIIYAVLQTSADDLALRYRMSYDGSAWGNLEKYEAGSYASAAGFDMSQQPYKALFYYAPSYEFASAEAFKLSSGKTEGTDEFLTWTSGEGYDVTESTPLVVSFGRGYSRLRISAPESEAVVLSSEDFIPAGYATTALGSTTLEASVNADGNAFFYGSWAEGADIRVSAYNSCNVLEGDRTFENRSASTDQKSYSMACSTYGSGYTYLYDLAQTATSTKTSFSAKIKATVTYVNGSYVHLEDKSGAIVLYQSNTGLTAGTTVDGEISGKIYTYKNLPEIQNATLTGLTLGSTGRIPLTEVTVADLLDDYDRYMSCRLLFKGVTIDTGLTSSNRTGQISQGGESIYIYSTLTGNLALLDAGLYGDLIAYPTIYNSTKELSIYVSSQFTETGGEKEESAFTEITEYGVYNATDTDNPTLAYEYKEGSDQLISDTSSSEIIFAIANIYDGSLGYLQIKSGSLAVGGSYSATAAFSSVSEDITLKVVGKNGKQYWLEDKTAHKGYIIYIE